MLLQRRVEMIQHQARLDLGGAILGIDSRMARRYLLLSITRPAPTVWPHWLVPAPRGTIGTFKSRAMSMAMATSGGAGHEHPTGMT
jgi:hypothetical protein